MYITNSTTIIRQVRKNPVPYKAGWRDDEIIDKALFDLVMEKLRVAGYTREHLDPVAAELRVKVYDMTMGADIFTARPAVGTRHLQWQWMRAACEHFGVERPSDETLPSVLLAPADLGYTSRYCEFRREAAVQEILKKRAAEAEMDRPSKSIKTESAPGPPESRELTTPTSLPVRPSASESAPAAEPETTAGADTIAAEEPAQPRSLSEELDEQHAQIQATQARAPMQDIPMSEIWSLMMGTMPYKPVRPATPSLAPDTYKPFDILFPSGRSWAACWDGAPSDYFKFNLSDAVRVREHPLGQGYYKIEVSQRAGTRCSLGNAEDVFNCWHKLQEWSRALFCGDKDIPIDVFFKKVHHETAAARRADYSRLDMVRACAANV